MNISGMPLAQVSNLRVNCRDITGIAGTWCEHVINKKLQLRDHFRAMQLKLCNHTINIAAHGCGLSFSSSRNRQPGQHCLNSHFTLLHFENLERT